MTVGEIQSYVGLGVTILGFLYVFARFRAEFELHKKVLNDLIARVERIDVRQYNMSEEFNFMKGVLYTKQKIDHESN